MNELQNTNLLEVKDLEVVYRTDSEVVRAVNGVSFSLKQGETLGIVGETGAGKTTTALSILRLLPQDIGHITGGSVVFEGQNLLTLKEADMRQIRGDKISMIFQDPMTSLNPVISVGDQILESLQLHNSEKRSPKELDERVDEIMELVGIPKSASGSIRTSSPAV